MVIKRPPVLTMLPRNPGLIVACASGTSVTLRPLLSLGYSCSSCRAIVLRFASACCTDTPGLSRPVTLKISPRRLFGWASSRKKPVVVCG